jgi:hypothetical protein
MAYRIHTGLTVGALQNIAPFTLAWDLSVSDRRQDKGSWWGMLDPARPLWPLLSSFLLMYAFDPDPRLEFLFFFFSFSSSSSSSSSFFFFFF